jgi:hypothetical protein
MNREAAKILKKSREIVAFLGVLCGLGGLK